MQCIMRKNAKISQDFFGENSLLFLPTGGRKVSVQPRSQRGGGGGGGDRQGTGSTPGKKSANKCKMNRTLKHKYVYFLTLMEIMGYYKSYIAKSWYNAK